MNTTIEANSEVTNKQAAYESAKAEFDAGQTAVETKPKGKVSPGAKAIKEAFAKARADDEQQLAAMTARILFLEKKLEDAGTVEQLPVEDAALEVAILKLEGMNKEKPDVLSLSLSKVLGFSPLFTAEQKKVWKARKSVMVLNHSNTIKAKTAEIIGYARKAVRTPHAIMSGVVKRNKDDKVTGFRLAARSMVAKPKSGKGKNGAKPSQPGAKLPKAGNAANPAKL